MTVSVVVRCLIATFDWLESVAWPWLLYTWRNCKAVAQTVREKLGCCSNRCVAQLDGLRCSIASRLDNLRAKSLVFRVFRSCLNFMLELLFYGVSACVMAALWMAVLF